MASVTPLGAGLVALSIFFLIIAAVATILRFRARYFSPRKWFLDDFMVVAALVSLLSYGVMDIVLDLMIYAAVDLPESTFITAAKIGFAQTIVTPILATFARLSIVYYYRRALSPCRSSIPTLIILYIVYIWGIVALALTIFKCIPISLQWEAISEGLCYPSGPEETALSISNLLVSTIVLCRPLTRVRTFREFRVRKRFCIGSVALLGFLVIAATTAATILNVLGYYYTSVTPLILRNVEVGLLVIFTCVLSLVSQHSLHGVKNQDVAERYEKPELAGEHFPRHELDSTNLAELPVPLPELLGTEQRHEADDTSIPRQGGTHSSSSPSE